MSGLCINLPFLHFAGGLRGASIVDSLDTLYIMGLMDEYNDAKEWVQTSLDLNSVSLFSLLFKRFIWFVHFKSKDKKYTTMWLLIGVLSLKIVLYVKLCYIY